MAACMEFTPDAEIRSGNLLKYEVSTACQGSFLKNIF